MGASKIQDSDLFEAIVAALRGIRTDLDFVLSEIRATGADDPDPDPRPRFDVLDGGRAEKNNS